MAPAFLALVVAIEVSGPDLPPEQRSAIEEACSQATGGVCRVNEVHGGESPDAVAIVSLSADRRQAIVEVGRERNERRVWLSRELDFEPQDALLERFRSIGLTIATLVGDEQEQHDREVRAEREAREGAKASTPVAPAQPSSEDVPASEPPARPGIHWSPLLSAGPIAGPGLESGWIRAGGFGRASLRAGRFPIWPTISVSYLLRPVGDDGLSATWMGFAAGVVAGSEWSTLRLAGRIRAEGLFERFSVVQTRPPTDRADRWFPGLKLALEGAWPSDGSIGAVAAGDLWLYRSGIRIRVADRIAARVPAENVTLSAGVELRF